MKNQLTLFPTVGTIVGCSFHSWVSLRDQVEPTLCWTLPEVTPLPYCFLVSSRSLCLPCSLILNTSLKHKVCCSETQAQTYRKKCNHGDPGKLFAGVWTLSESEKSLESFKGHERPGTARRLVFWALHSLGWQLSFALPVHLDKDPANQAPLSSCTTDFLKIV